MNIKKGEKLSEQAHAKMTLSMKTNLLKAAEKLDMSHGAIIRQLVAEFLKNFNHEQNTVNP